MRLLNRDQTKTLEQLITQVPYLVEYAQGQAGRAEVYLPQSEAIRLVTSACLHTALRTGPHRLYLDNVLIAMGEIRRAVRTLEKGMEPMITFEEGRTGMEPVLVRRVG